MMMYFHGGFNEIILFECWTIDSVGTAEIIRICNYCTIPALSLGLCAYIVHLEQTYNISALRIRIRIRIWIHMFLGLLDPDPLARGTDPDPGPSIIMQK
jgi:hypothetical protein